MKGEKSWWGGTRPGAQPSGGIHTCTAGEQGVDSGEMQGLLLSLTFVSIHRQTYLYLGTVMCHLQSRESERGKLKLSYLKFTRRNKYKTDEYIWK